MHSQRLPKCRTGHIRPSPINGGSPHRTPTRSLHQRGRKNRQPRKQAESQSGQRAQSEFADNRDRGSHENERFFEFAYKFVSVSNFVCVFVVENLIF